MWEILAMASPWSREGLHRFACIQALQDGERPRILPEEESDAPPGYLALLKDCWAQNPDKRKTFEGISRRLKKIRTTIAVSNVKPQAVIASDSTTEPFQRQNMLVVPVAGGVEMMDKGV